MLTSVGGIVLIESSNGAQIARVKSSWGFKQVIFSENEAVVAANDSERIAVYDLKARKEITVKVVDGISIAISKTGRLVWVTSGYASPQVIFLNGKLASRSFPDQFLLGFERSVFGGFMDGDSKVVMRTILDKVGIWDWKLNTFSEIPTKAESVAVAESIILTVTAEGVMSLWDSGANKLFTFDGSMKRGLMTPDGARIITLSKEGSLTLDVQKN